MAAQTTTYQMWKRLAGRPGGTRLFSTAAMVRVPYFASIVPHVVRMEPGLAEVTVPKWFFVYNHLHTVHAIASCNAAEIAMGMLMEATVPTSHRWIPKAMSVQYLDKATSSLRATARVDPPDFSTITEGVELTIPVSVTDKAGTEVVHADITTWVTPADHTALMAALTRTLSPERILNGLPTVPRDRRFRAAATTPKSAEIYSVCPSYPCPSPGSARAFSSFCGFTTRHYWRCRTD